MTEPEQRMPRAYRGYVIAMCAIIGAAFAYAACSWGQWPLLLYVPMTGELRLTPTSAITINYFGTVAWGLGGGLVGAGVGAVLCRLVPRMWSHATLHLFGAWAITAILLAGSYFTWSLWPW